MKIKGITDEDFVNYKKASMFIAFPNCSFKCDHECGRAVCQNSALAKSQTIDIPISMLIDRYGQNPISKAVVCGGLEPLDSWEELQAFIRDFRYYTPDDIVIYTGYEEEEIKDKIEWLSLFENIIIKFGRYRTNEPSHYDNLLGVSLMSSNQYAKAYNVMEGYC
jgi:hypothetical protein